MSKLNKGVPAVKLANEVLDFVIGATQHFPKNLRETLGYRLTQQSSIILENIISANRLECKVKGLEHIQENIYLLELLSGIAYNLKVFSGDKFTEFLELIEKLEKQVNGWLRYSIKERQHHLSKSGNGQSVAATVVTG